MNPESREAGAVLRHARWLLFERGELPVGLMDEPVERSWRRCLAAGLVPRDGVGDSPHLAGGELRHAAERRQELIATAKPIMEYLFGQTRGSGCMVILSDEQGVVLQSLGDAEFLNRAERVQLMPGASWDERYRGTNAIGTALVEAAPVVVHGAEHYLERNGFLTCAAAPLCAPDGRMLGVLDMSGEQRRRLPHTFGLVRAAAQMIENRLFAARHGNAMRVRFHPLAEGIGSIAEGMAAISEAGLVLGANQAGMAFLGLTPADLGVVALQRLLQMDLPELIRYGAQHRHAPVQVVHRGGGQLFMSVEPARASARILVHRPSQAKADALAALDTGDSRLKALIAKARRILDKPIGLLLQGESGVGKEVFAHAMHESGARRSAAFVAVNCAALPETLIEAELFGYGPGAFTGARKAGAPGRIREAHGGTLFLDEIGDMPMQLQARLLRVLQDRLVSPLGGGRAVAVDFALICASHRDLRQEVAAGRFRADLYYRINGLALLLPPLRERGDLAVLTARLLEALAPRPGIGLAPDVAAAMAAYAWPGNLRQLANVLRTACALLDDDDACIDWVHLPDDVAEDLRHCPRVSAASVAARGETLRQLSAAAVDRAVLASQGNMAEAARRLGISRSTLYRRLKGGAAGQTEVWRGS